MFKSVRGGSGDVRPKQRTYSNGNSVSHKNNRRSYLLNKARAGSPNSSKVTNLGEGKSWTEREERCKITDPIKIIVKQIPVAELRRGH